MFSSRTPVRHSVHYPALPDPPPSSSSPPPSVLELPAAAQGAQQLLCTLAVLTETPGPRDPARREETRRAAEKKKRKGKEHLPAWPPFRGTIGSRPSSMSATRPCRAAARPPPGRFGMPTCRAPGAFTVLIGGGCLSGRGVRGSQNGRAGFWRKGVQAEAFGLGNAQEAVWGFRGVFVGKQTVLLQFSDSVMRRSTLCNRGPNLGTNSCRRLVLAVELRVTESASPQFLQLQGSPPQDGCAHASSPGSLPLRPHHPKQQKESRRRPFRSGLKSSPSNPIAAEDPTAAFGLQDVHTYINRKLKEKNTCKQRCHREAS